jgi:dipeptidyl aminopeptidase/acylaminoacyl peptidase
VRPDDLLEVEVAGEPQLSPDGAWVLYLVTRPRLQPDGYASELFVVPAAGDAAPRSLLASDARLRRPRWSPDGRRIAVIADLGDGPQVTLLGLDSPRRRQITQGGAVTDLCWSPDGRHLAFCAEPPGADGAAPRVRAYARIPIRYDGLGLLEAEGPALHVIPADGGPARRLAGGPYTHVAPRYSPDGRWLACARVEHYNTYRHGGGEVWVLPAGGGEGRCVASGVGFHQGMALAWCPDSRRLLYVSSHMMMTGRTPRLLRASLDGGAPVSLTESFDRFVGHGPGSHTDLRFGSGPVPVATDDAFAYFCAGDGGTMPIYRVPLGGGTVEQVTPPGRLCVAEFSLGPSGRLVYTAMDDFHSDQVFCLDPGAAPRRLTEVGESFWRRAQRVPMERFTLPGRDGLEAEGWICRPAGARGPVPAVLHIHGGPHLQFGYTLDFRHTLWASAGWATVFINPPGSSGYGHAFAAALRGDWGGIDYPYQMAALDHCIEVGWVRSDRLAVTGTSYGGFMTYTVLGRTDRFRCGIVENGVSNLYTQALTSDNGANLFLHGSAPPWEAPHDYLARSPISHAARIRTPLLIQHAEGDGRVTIDQSEQMFTALRHLGREVELVRYPHDPHFFSLMGRPSNRVALMGRQLDWFRRHLDPGSAADI